MALETMELFKKNLAGQEGMKVLTAQELQEVQKVLLEITSDVAIVCEENDIFYMLGGGTALGALRHHGFIPWDDDVDLNMFHADFERLAQGLEKRFPGKYYIQLPGKTKGYYSTFAQIHKKGTVFMETMGQKEEEAGIKIDVFPIENTFNGAFIRKIHGMGCDAAHLLLSCYRIWLRRKELEQVSKTVPKVRRVVNIKKILALPIVVAPNFWNHMFQKWFGMCKKCNTKYVVIPSGRKHFFGELYERDKFCRTEKVNFENTRFEVTRDISEYMKRLYGNDYMVPPTDEEQERHMVYRVKV